MTDTSQAPQDISPKALSDALAALGAYAQPPTDAQLAAAELREGRAGLVARLSNALYGSALAHVMTAEIAVAQTGSDTGYRHDHEHPLRERDDQPGRGPGQPKTLP